MLRANLNREIPEPERAITEQAEEPISAVLNKVVEQVFRLTRAHGAAVVLRDAQGLVCRASLGLAPPVGSQLTSESGFTRECFETGQVVQCEDAENDARIRPPIARSLHLRSALAVPILGQGSVLGVILVFSSTPFAFHTAPIVSLQRIAQSLTSISAPHAAQPELAVTRGSIAPAATLVFSLAEDPEVQLRPVSSPQERLIDSPQITTWDEAGQPVSAQVTLGIPWRLNARASLAAGSALSLLFLSVFFVLSHHRSKKIPAGNLRTVETLNRKNTDLPSRPAARHPDSKTVIEIDLVRKVITPPSSTLVIEGAPSGTQMFVDNRFTGAIGLGGQERISTVAPSQQRVHLTLNGYQDHDQSIEVKSDKTSTVTAKLEPFQLPISSPPTSAPMIAAAPAIPAPGVSARASLPISPCNTP